MKKHAVLSIIVILTASSLISVSFASTSIAIPSVPEFTVQLVAHPYDVPTTTTTATTVDQYTGKETTTTITHPGYHVENKSIEIRIKNQPFTSYTDADGNEIHLYYNVRVKGHFGQDWKELYSPYKDDFRGGSGSFSQSPSQSSSGYTVLSCSADYPDGAHVDFQVERLAGHYDEVWPYMAIAIFYWVFTGCSSGWSNTQTITIGDSEPAAIDIATSPNALPSQNDSQSSPSTSTSQNQTSSMANQSGNQTGPTIDQPTSQMGFYGIVVVTIAVLAAGVGLLVYVKRRRREAEQP